MPDNKISRKENRLGLLLWFRLSRFFNESIQQSSQHLKEWDLSVAQFDVLVQVGSHELITQQELADKLLVSKGNISQLLTRMERLELIKRQQEWKVKYISLTEKGKELYKDVVPRQETFQSQAFSKLDQNEQLQLLELLRKLNR